MTLVDNAHGLAGIEGQQQVAGQTVARATGNDGQGRAGVDQRTCYLVDGAVAANGHDNVFAGGSTLAGYLGGMARILGEDRRHLEPVVVQHFVCQRRDVVLRLSARNGVDDECDGRFLLAHLLQKYKKSWKVDVDGRDFFCKKHNY